MDGSDGTDTMEPTEPLGDYMVVILRLQQDDAGGWTGVLERVSTGQKVRFHGLETLSRAVASLLSTASAAS